MTEVRPIPFILSDEHENHSQQLQEEEGQQYGLFATKVYNEGDIIFDNEVPLIQLSITTLPMNEQEWIQKNIATLKENDDKTNDTSTSSSSNNTTIVISDAKVYHMIEIGLCFLLYLVGNTSSSSTGSSSVLSSFDEHIEQDSILKQIRTLYHPSIDNNVDNRNPNRETNNVHEQQQLVTWSKQAIDCIQQIILRNESDNNNNNEDQVNEGKVQDVDYGSVPTKLLRVKQFLRIPNKNKVRTILQEIILIYYCNAFENGYIYSNTTISRINHSCNPNTVVVVRNDENINHNTRDQQQSFEQQQQTLIAAVHIPIGTEITISYLIAPFLYADRTVRQSILQQDKYFTCNCVRCGTTNNNDNNDTISNAIPCPKCHPRISDDIQHNVNTTKNNSSSTPIASSSSSSLQLFLSEDVQYDDDQTVQYVYPIISSKTSNFICNRCHTDNTNHLTTSSSSSLYQHLFQLNQKIINQVVTFIHQRPNIHMKNKNVTSATLNDGEDDTDDAAVVAVSYQEELQHLLKLCSSVLGAKHWTTNMLLLYHLNDVLSKLHQRSILQLSSSDDNDDEDEDDVEMTIAESIDTLQRIERFVDGMKSTIQLHKGHLLCNVIIGVARVLVSLGDVKSQQYASKWIDKILKHVQLFESPGIQTVVQALHVAWQRNNDDNDCQSRKRAKR